MKKLRGSCIDEKCDNLLRDVSLAQKGGIIMYLWWVNYFGHYWGSYVIETKRSKARYRFWSEHTEGDYTDIRCVKIKPADGYEPAVLDDEDDPILAELGVGYVDPDEMEE